jgi:predicted ferric reductase
MAINIPQILPINPLNGVQSFPTNFEMKSFVTNMSRATGHLPDFLLALVLLPISRNAFFSKRLGISPQVAIRYHQFVANLFMIALIIHFVFASFAWKYRAGNVFNYILHFNTINDTNPLHWTINDWKWQTGNLAVLCAFLIRLLSLPIIRRRRYDIFMTSHLILPIPMVVFGSIHASSTFIYSFPALALYVVDLCFRLHAYMCNPLAVVSFEPAEILRIETKNTLKKYDRKSRSGLYYDLHVKSVSKVFSRPFSVARFTKKDTLVFYIDKGKSETWKGYLGSQMADAKISTTANAHDIIINLEANLNINLSLQGPFGARVFNMDRIDVLACFVGGIGIAAISQLLFECIESHPKKRIYLFWSIRSKDLLHFTLFKELVAEIHSNVFIQVNVSDNLNSKVAAPLRVEVQTHRLTLGPALDRVMEETSEKKTVGLYTCASEEYMTELEIESAKYYGRIIFKRELFNF